MISSQIYTYITCAPSFYYNGFVVTQRLWDKMYSLNIACCMYMYMCMYICVYIVYILFDIYVIYNRHKQTYIYIDIYVQIQIQIYVYIHIYIYQTYIYYTYIDIYIYYFICMLYNRHKLSYYIMYIIIYTMLVFLLQDLNTWSAMDHLRRVILSFLNSSLHNLLIHQYSDV